MARFALFAEGFCNFRGARRLQRAHDLADRPVELLDIVAVLAVRADAGELVGGDVGSKVGPRLGGGVGTSVGTADGIESTAVVYTLPLTYKSPST